MDRWLETNDESDDEFLEKFDRYFIGNFGEGDGVLSRWWCGTLKIVLWYFQGVVCHSVKGGVVL